MNKKKVLENILAWFSPIGFGWVICFGLTFLACKVLKLYSDIWFILIVPIFLIYIICWFHLAKYLVAWEKGEKSKYITLDNLMLDDDDYDETSVDEAIHYFDKQGNEPAYPQHVSYKDGEVDFYGLTKREYFAGLAMQGLLANKNGGMQQGGGMTFSPIEISEIALLHADALVAELEKTEDK